MGEGNVATFTFSSPTVTSYTGRNGAVCKINGSCAIASSTAGTSGSVVFPLPEGVTYGAGAWVPVATATTATYTLTLTSGSAVGTYDRKMASATGTTFAATLAATSIIELNPFNLVTIATDKYSQSCWPGTDATLTIVVNATNPVTTTLSYGFTFVSPVA